uniref:Uncharacterized protein n=1 Tax=Ditylenchus dipsaci TaxID=166011 RepID=A0A915DI01_9BILA
MIGKSTVGDEREVPPVNSNSERHPTGMISNWHDPTGMSAIWHDPTGMSANWHDPTGMSANCMTRLA